MSEDIDFKVPRKTPENFSKSRLKKEFNQFRSQIRETLIVPLDEIKSQFEHWRATRTKQREKIPDYLWSYVKTLLDRYALQDITHALRLNVSQIKDNIKIEQKINFVEVHSSIKTQLTN